MLRYGSAETVYAPIGVMERERSFKSNSFLFFRTFDLRERLSLERLIAGARLKLTKSIALDLLTITSHAFDNSVYPTWKLSCSPPSVIFPLWTFSASHGKMTHAQDVHVCRHPRLYFTFALPQQNLLMQVVVVVLLGNPTGRFRLITVGRVCFFDVSR